MDIFSVIKGRRSVRLFTKKPVSKEIVHKIIEAGNWAPSACNRQAWRFIIINNPEIKKKIVEAGTAYFVKNAPLLILITYDNRTDNLEYLDHIQSAAASIQNMNLVAYSLGIGTCWINNLPPKKRLRKLLKIPSYFEPIALLALGHYERLPQPLPRQNRIEDLISMNKFAFKTKKISKGKLAAKRTARRLYIRLPATLKKRLEPFARKFEKRFDK